MGLLDLYAAQADTSAPNPVETPPSTLGERLGATAAETFGPGRYFNLMGAQRDHWQQAIDDVHGVTNETFLNPYGPVTPEEMGRLGNQPAITEERKNKIIQASRTARAAGADGLYDPENIDRYIGEEQQRRSDIAGRLVGTGNGIGNFIGGAAMSSIEPVNALGMLLPIGRLGTATASAVGRTWLGSVAREAGVQGAFNAALGAGTEALDYSAKQTTGQPTDVLESLGNVAQQGVFGALMGASIKSLHLLWNGMPPEVRAKAPTEVKDAFRVIEADALFGDRAGNRLGLDPLLHDRYMANAADPALRARAPTLEDLQRGAVAGTDTPMTALGTILQQAPDQIRAGGVDLGPFLERARALPDSEIEAFARESKPNSFARLDRVEGQLSDLRGKLDEVTQRAPSAADLLDHETALRVQAIDQDLAAPAVTRKARAALEQEREMIMQTVDPADRLPKQAETAQRAEQADIQKQITKLEAQREEAKTTADQATADLRRKLDRYAELAGPAPEVAQDLGFKEPADLGAAIQRADLWRQARIVREALPPGEYATDGTRLAETPRFDTTVREEAKPEATPEELQALDSQAAAVLEKPGALGPMRRSAVRDLEAADVQAKDAAKVMACVMGAPL